MTAAGQPERSGLKRGSRSRAAWTLVAVFVVVVVVVGLLGRAFFLQQRAIIEAQKNAELSAIRDLKVGQIVQWRERLLADGRTAVNDPTITDELAGWLGNPSDKADADRLRAWIGGLGGQQGYASALIMSPDESRWMTSVGGPAPTQRDRDLVRAVLASGEATLTDLYLDPASGLPRLDVVAPLKAGTGSTLAVAILHRDPSQYLYPLIQSWPTPSASSETLLFEKSGASVLYLNELRFKKNTALKTTFPLTNTRLLAVQALNGSTRIVTGVDYLGTPVVGAVGPIPGTPWYIVAKVAQSEEFAPVAQMERLTYAAVILVSILLGLGLGVAWRQRAAAYYRERMESEREARLLEQQYDYVTRYANDIVLLTDTDSNILQANERASSVYQYSNEELLEMNLSEMSPADPIWLADHLAQGGGSSIYETVHVRRDGTRVDVEVSARSLESPEGKPLILAIIRDITERKAAEEALRDSEERFRYVWSRSAVAKSITKPTGEIDVNEAFLEMLGYTRDELLERGTWQQISHPDDTSATNEYVRAMLAGEFESARFEKRYLRKDGAVVWADVTTSLRRDADGNPDYFMTTVLDVTAKKQAEAELARQMALFTTALDNLPVGIFMVEAPSGRPLLANDRAKAILGRGILPDANEQNMADVYRAFMAGTDTLYPVDEIPINQGIHGLVSHIDDMEVERPDGTRAAIEVWGTPVQDADGTTWASLVGFLDITERKRAEAELRERTDDLVRSNTELEKFAYIASHDLQEPLRMIASYTQLLQRRYEGKLDSDADEFIGYAVDGANRMQRLINELLAYSRVGTQGAPFSMSDLGEVLEGTLQGLGTLIAENDALVTHDDLPTVWCDPTQIGQVFQNLIVNAIKFHSEAPPKIHVGARHEDHEWVFSVSDNGLGIEPEYFDRIFVIFQRLQSRAEYAGTGMGLAICKRIIERHGGRIWVESSPGEGSKFYFTLRDDKGE